MICRLAQLWCEMNMFLKLIYKFISFTEVQKSKISWWTLGMLFDLFVFHKQIESTSLVTKAFYLNNFGHIQLF